MPSHRTCPSAWSCAALPIEPRSAPTWAQALGASAVFEWAGNAWYGVGEACALEAADAPFALVDQAEEILRSIDPADGVEAEPVWLGGFAFDPARTDRGPWAGFPAGRLVLPELLLHTSGDRAWAMAIGPAESRDTLRPRLERALEVAQRSTRSARCPSAADVAPETPREAWDAGVEAALSAFATGALQKVVLARTIRAALRGPADPLALLGRFRALHPDCFRFAFGAGARCFLGATPELLFTRQGNTASTMALAGSVRRDADPERDRALTAALLDDPKERHEHALVADAIRHALAPISTSLHAQGPEIRALRNVAHLETAFQATLREGTSTRALLEALHPTPAVCGAPRAPARALLREIESFDRGWYAGPVGVVGRRSATFAVALRCMLLERDSARLFVGAGLVPGSTAEREWAETCVKSQAMLRALEG